MAEAPRFDAQKLAPDAVDQMRRLDQLVGSKLDPRLFHLIKMRASQINGCAYCLDMHSHDALAAGETPQRLFVLDGWRESPLFTDKERAVLEWVEAITWISDVRDPQALFERLKPHASEEEIAYLTLAAAMINSWNRIAIASGARHKARVQAGQQQPEDRSWRPAAGDGEGARTPS
jgi:AhpD family alkylhydroperoxidase